MFVASFLTLRAEKCWLAKGTLFYCSFNIAHIGPLYVVKTSDPWFLLYDTPIKLDLTVCTMDQQKAKKPKNNVSSSYLLTAKNDSNKWCEQAIQLDWKITRRNVVQCKKCLLGFTWKLCSQRSVFFRKLPSKFKGCRGWPRSHQHKSRGKSFNSIISVDTFIMYAILIRGLELCTALTKYLNILCGKCPQWKNVSRNNYWFSIVTHPSFLAAS